MTEHWTMERYHQEMGTAPAKMATQRPSKYGAKKTKVDGITFDSAREAEYYTELKMRVAACDIAGFGRQVDFILQDGDGTVIRYRADFVVWQHGTCEVHEVKGFFTEGWAIKEKLFRARFPGIPLIVVK